MDYKTASEKMRFNKVRAHVKKFLPSPTKDRKSVV